MDRERLLDIFNRCADGQCSGCTFEGEAYCQEMLNAEAIKYLTTEKHFRFEDEEGADD